MTKKKSDPPKKVKPPIEKVGRAIEWNSEDEINFIKRLGAHAGNEIKSERQWLDSYFKTHARSPHKHHQDGCFYCQERLKELTRAR